MIGFDRPAGALWWMRSKVRRQFDQMAPDGRASFDQTPTSITLPVAEPADQLDDTARIGDYLVYFPPPILRGDTAKFIRLTYAGFVVVLRPPFSTADIDAASQQLQFRDGFDQHKATFHLRPSDLDAQKDMTALKRFLILISQKQAMCDKIEEFERADMKGVILWRAHGRNDSVVEAFLPNHASCGVLFFNGGRLTLDGVHHYLASLRFAHR